MIFYYCMTKFHLIFSITHKIVKHPEEQAILFLYDNMQGVNTNVERLNETRIFNQIYIVPELDFRRHWKPLKEDASEEEILHNVKSSVSDFEKWLPVKITNRDTLYIANDHWSLGIYCIYKKIHYNYYEDGVGMLSKPDYSYELVKKVNVTHSVIAKYLGAFGQNNNVIKKIADLNNQNEGFFDSKAEHFCLREQLKMLPYDIMNDLLYIFDAPKYTISESSTILLTEHFINMKRLSIEGQKELYTMLVDLFSAGSQLYIKPHPNDFHVNYNKLFPNAKIISRFFPSELLPYCFDNDLSLALAACSTSVFGLKEKAHKTLRFDTNIEEYYTHLYKYSSLPLILPQFQNRTIVPFGLHNDIIDAFHILDQYTNNSSDKETGKIYIIGSYSEEIEDLCLNEDDILICLNEDEEYFFLREKYSSNFDIHIVQLKKNLQEENTVTNTDTEYIWIICDNKYSKIIDSIKEERIMTNTGLILNVDSITDNDKIKIKILEGNLKSALDKIERYEQKQFELNETIKELEDKLHNYNDQTIAKLVAVLKNNKFIF